MIQSKERVKDFDNWNKLKKEIHFRERKFYVMLTERNKITNELVTLERSVLASHAKLFDTKRIVEHMGYLKQEDFQKTKATLRDLLF